MFKINQKISINPFFLFKNTVLGFVTQHCACGIKHHFSGTNSELCDVILPETSIFQLTDSISILSHLHLSINEQN